MQPYLKGTGETLLPPIFCCAVPTRWLFSGLLALTVALAASSADQPSNRTSGPLANFSAGQRGPLGMYVTGASLHIATVGGPEQCAEHCLRWPKRACISFSFFPDESLRHGFAATCELHSYSPHYALQEGRNATYYLRTLPRDDRPAVQHIPWRLSPPTKNVTLSPGSLLRKTFETNIVYLLGQYSVDDVLYWFRDRAGKPQPPGAKNHGWDGGPGAPDYPFGLKGSIAGIYMMGLAGHLRWEENATQRALLTAVVDGIKECREQDGYMMAYQRNTTGYTEHPDYVLSWMTYGLIEAAASGDGNALSLVRDHLDWFNYCEYLPLFLPPDGGPGTDGYVNEELPEVFEGVRNPDAVPAIFEPQHGHNIYLIYQGMIHNTRMALSTMGKQRDVDVVTDLYQEDWWLSQLAAEETDAIWARHWYPHNYEVTALEAYLDLYVLTGNQTYLRSVKGAWNMFRAFFIQPGGSMAINEADAFLLSDGPDKGQPVWNTSVRFPPGSYYLCAGATVPPVEGNEQPGECNLNTGELCGSSFWLKLNQRFHRLEPDNETYVAEMERSIYNVGLAAQVASGSAIRYFARLHGYKQPGYNIGTCCEGQGTRMFGQLPEYLYSHVETHEPGIKAALQSQEDEQRQSQQEAEQQRAGPDGVFIDIYSASVHRWHTSAGVEVILTMETEWPYSEQATLRVSFPSGTATAAATAARFTLSFRAPSWLANDTITLTTNSRGRRNGTTTHRGSYVHMQREWSDGDSVFIPLPMALRAERYTGRSSVVGYGRHCFFYGPILLAALSGNGALEFCFDVSFLCSTAILSAVVRDAAWYSPFSDCVLYCVVYCAAVLCRRPRAKRNNRS
jgi:hypothetical protein